MAQQTVVVDIALLGKMAGYIEMLVKDPHSTVFATLSDIYRTFGLHEEAVAVAQKGSEMLPSYVPGFIALGRALAEKGDPAGATEAYHRALALDPVNLAALTGLASSCLGCGQSEEALALLTRAQLIDPEDEVVRQLFLIVKKLATISSPAFTSPSSFVSTSLHLPHEIVTDKKEPGERLAEVPLLPPIATATLADIYIKQGFPEKALKVFSDLLEVNPGNREIRLRYQDLLQRINVLPDSPSAEAVPAFAKEIVPVTRTVDLPKGTGKDALIALYGLWLDAVNRRRADVH